MGRPGGNVTGVTQMTGEVAPKRVELAHELVPQATVFGMLINPTNPLSDNVKRDSQAAALKLGIQLNILHASTDAELDKACTDAFLITGSKNWPHWRPHSHLSAIGATTDIGRPWR